MSFKLGHVGSESRLLGQILVKLCERPSGPFWAHYSQNLVKKLISMKTGISLKGVHLELATRSLGQMSNSRKNEYILEA